MISIVLRIGLDIDDTMTRHWAFFCFLANALVDAGHEVYVITLREDFAATRDELASRGLRYTELICADLDEMEGSVEAWKAAVCKDRGVEILFDDMEEVMNHLPETTLGLMPVDPARGLVYYD